MVVRSSCFWCVVSGRLQIGVEFCLESGFVAGTDEPVNDFAILEEDKGWDIANA